MLLVFDVWDVAKSYYDESRSGLVVSLGPVLVNASFVWHQAEWLRGVASLPQCRQGGSQSWFYNLAKARFTWSAVFALVKEQTARP